MLLLVGPGAMAQSQMADVVRSAAKRADAGVLFQVSTLDALAQGVFNGSMTVAKLKQQGDFGLGTYAGL